MIYVFLADGFEEIEALATVDILRRADIKTLTVGIGTKAPTGTHGIKVEADITEAEATANGLDGVVLPGGLPGAWNLKASRKVEELTRYCNENGKLDGLPLNRSLRDENGEIYDIIAGTFFLCGAPPDQDHFTSLTPEQKEAYLDRFRLPEYFL